MRGLFLRLMVGALLAFCLIQLAAAGLAWMARDGRVERERAALMDEKLAWALERLEAVPPYERGAQLQILRPSLQLPLELVPPQAPIPPWSRRVTLRDGTQLVALGPGGPAPPPLPILGLQVLLPVGVFGLVLVLLGRPLVRDLLVLERTSERIARGELTARTSLSDGPIATLGRQFDTMADQVETLVDGHKGLMAAVSHEIRTPLARMRFQLEMLRDDPSPAMVDRIEAEVDAIDGLLSELLELARLDAPPREQPDPDGATTRVREICDRMRPLAGVQLEVVGEGRLPIGPRDLVRIVENLVSNAQRHANSVVRVSLGSGMLTVEDDGPGIPPGDVERIFEPFHTGDPSRSRQLGGVGLGLSLVQRAARRWGAAVSVDTGDLGGARFRLRWPT